jgi:2-furoyl-CoA dehydrogenase large subunit
VAATPTGEPAVNALTLSGERSLTINPFPGHPEDFRFIGKPMPVTEDRRFVRGRGRYINDLVLPHMLHLGVASARVAHARLISVDVSAARAAPGVVAVLTGADMTAMMEPIPQNIPLPNVNWYPLAVDKIRFAGEWIAAVIATSRAAAEDAAELVEAEYEELPVVNDPEEALRPEAPILHDAQGSNIVWDQSHDWDSGVDEAFARAERVFEYRWRWNRHSGVPMETFGCVADVSRSTGMLDVWASHQNPGQQAELVSTLRLPSARLHQDIDVGGSYGSKRGRKQIFLTALAAMTVQRPVKFIEDRIENMEAGDGHGPDRVYYVRLAASAEGDIDAIDIRFVEDLGAYCGRGPQQIVKPMAAVVGPYHIKHARFGGHGVLTNKTNQVPYRGAGQSPHNFMVERSIDRVAAELGIDRLEIRRRNYIQPDQFPYLIPSGAVYDSGNYPGVLDMAIEKAGLDRLLDMRAAAREEGRLVGIGLAGAVEPGGPINSWPEGARIEIDRRGHITVTIGFQSSGQAHESMVTQIMCEEFGVQPGDVTVNRGDGLAGIIGGATTGSRMTLSLGTALKVAADRVRDKMRVHAASLLEADPHVIEVVRGVTRAAGSAGPEIPLSTLAAAAYDFDTNNGFGENEPGLISDVAFPGPRPLLPVPPKGFASYAFDFHVPVVEIDPETFEITFLGYTVVHDCGTPINPLVVHGFVYGGIGHGVGGALYEQFSYDDAGQLAGSFMDYLCPTAAEVPRVAVHDMITPSPLHPYGAKGAAEGAYLTAPAAIASAVEDALSAYGIVIDQVPITPRLLFDKWREATAGADGADGADAGDGARL